MQSEFNKKKVIKHFDLTDDATLSYRDLAGSGKPDFVIDLPTKFYIFDVSDFDRVIVDYDKTLTCVSEDKFNTLNFNIPKGKVVCMKESIKSDRHVYIEHIKKFRKFFVLQFENLKLVFFRKTYSEMPIKASCWFAYKADLVESLNNVRNVFDADIYIPRDYDPEN